MSVASPVLERKVNTEAESDYRKEIYGGTVLSDDEKHNSKISSNYAKLINPECKLHDIITREAEPVKEREPLFMTVHREERNEKPYLVENARADSDIFRADSAINRRAESKVIVASNVEEEENEDLRPTQTTIQYKTAGVKTNTEEGKIENASSKKRLSKKEKITIAAIVSVVIALFVLIIINSAIISNVSSDISALQSSLESAKVTYTEVIGERQEYLANLQGTVDNFAISNGMILK